MKTETLNELRTLIQEEFNTEVENEQAEMLANQFVDYFSILQEISERI